jgi:glycosyltransferase involved in cell wall biosynthesis
MKISVAICTWNRARLLDQTLTAMQTLRIPEGVEWELLVVNNRCTDDTDTVIAWHQKKLPIRRLYEPELGHSNSRNCAVAAARGDYLLWTDDDVLVDPGWLEAYVAAGSAWPEAGYFGGAIEPWYECPPPKWIQPNLAILEGMLVIRDLGSTERPFCGNEQPWGANMAFRTELLRRHRFDSNLGRKGRVPILGDETALIAQLNAEGVQGIWIPSARARHFVSAKRTSTRYLWEYFSGLGQTKIRMEGRPEGRDLYGAPRWMYVRYMDLLIKYCCRRLLGDPGWIREYVGAAQTLGMIVECRSISGRGRASG